LLIQLSYDHDHDSPFVVNILDIIASCLFIDIYFFRLIVRQTPLCVQKMMSQVTLPSSFSPMAKKGLSDTRESEI
jgi:hypothetical protein